MACFGCDFLGMAYKPILLQYPRYTPVPHPESKIVKSSWMDVSSHKVGKIDSALMTSRVEAHLRIEIDPICL